MRWFVLLCLALAVGEGYYQKSSGSQCLEDHACKLAPPPIPNIDSINVQLISHICLEDYCEHHTHFKYSVAAMTKQFIETSDIKVNYDISIENVVVLAIKQCQTSCIQFTFGLRLNDQQQLKSSDLQRMWEELALLYFPTAILESDGSTPPTTTLEPDGSTPPTTTLEPDGSTPPTTTLEPTEFELSELHWALILMCTILISFLIVLYLLRKLAFRFKDMNDRKLKPRDSQVADVVGKEYPFYEPNLTGANQRNSGV